MREKIYKKFGGHCAYCGCEITLKNFVVEHVVPKRNFVLLYMSRSELIPVRQRHLTVNDAEHFDNKYPACRSCNSYKDTMDLEKFRKELGQLISRLNTRSTQYKIAKRFGMIEEISKPIEFYYEQYEKICFSV